MAVQDRLQIILITYNRAKFVDKTLKQFFADNSPLKNYDFLVLSNNSTDNTENVVKEWQKVYPNIRYSKNRYNLGISGNIAKAMEIADKDYVWIIGDDDKFDFSNWQEVEDAINNNEKIICVARYGLPDNVKKCYDYQVGQLTFITGGIYKTELFNDTTMRNAFDNIFTLFPHLAPVVKLLNDGGKIYVVDKAISDNGMEEHTDCSYIRGISKKSELYPRTRTMSWIVGYAAICQGIHDKYLRQGIFINGVNGILGGEDALLHCLKRDYFTRELLMQVAEVYAVVPEELALKIKFAVLKKLFKSFIYEKKSDKRMRYINLFGGLIHFSMKKKCIE